MKRALVFALGLAAIACTRRPQPTLPQPIEPTRAELEAPPPDPNARAECGNDRRCRIERMRRRGQRQLQHRAAVEATAQQGVDDAHDRIETNRVVRARYPWLVENTVSDHMFGIQVGLHPIPNFYFGIGFSYLFRIGHYTYDELSSTSIGTNDTLVIDAEIRWIMFEHNISPYLAGGFHVALGSMWSNSYSTDPERGYYEDSYSSPSLEAHSLHVGLGLDITFDFGLRIRAGALMRPLIWVRARWEEENDTLAEEGFRDAWRLFGAEGAVGWAF